MFDVEVCPMNGPKVERVVFGGISAQADSLGSRLKPKAKKNGSVVMDFMFEITP